MRYFNLFGFLCLLLIVVLIACEKEEGLQDIEVSVKLIDQNWYPLTDYSGVSVTVTRGNETYQGITNEHGKYVLSKLPYGIFNVKLEKDGFISELIRPEIINHTSDSVWLHSFRMVEIPNFGLTIDSIFLKSRNEDRAFAYGDITDLKGMPAVQYGLRLFFSNTPDVSKDNYQFYHFGTIMGRLIKNGRYEMWISNFSGGILEGDYDTLYVRVYPCAFYTEWTKLRKEGLGIPAEVFKWVLPESLK